MLNLLRPHIEPSPNTDPFVILNHIFDTYRTLQNLLQLHSNDIQPLTLSQYTSRTLSKNLFFFKLHYSLILLEIILYLLYSPF